MTGRNINKAKVCPGIIPRTSIQYTLIDWYSGDEIHLATSVYLSRLYLKYKSLCWGNDDISSYLQFLVTVDLLLKVMYLVTIRKQPNINLMHKYSLLESPVSIGETIQFKGNLSRDFPIPSSTSFGLKKLSIHSFQKFQKILWSFSYGLFWCRTLAI